VRLTAGERDEARGYLELFGELASPALFARELEQVRLVLAGVDPAKEWKRGDELALAAPAWLSGRQAA
jgi:hypothetical protein